MQLYHPYDEPVDQDGTGINDHQEEGTDRIHSILSPGKISGIGDIHPDQVEDCRNDPEIRPHISAYPFSVACAVRGVDFSGREFLENKQIHNRDDGYQHKYRKYLIGVMVFQKRKLRVKNALETFCTHDHQGSQICYYKD